MGKPTSTGKPSWASNAGGAVRGIARAMAVGRGKKLGLYKRESAPGEATGVPLPAVTSKRRKKPSA